MKTGICFDGDEKTPDLGSTEGLKRIFAENLKKNRTKNQAKSPAPATKAQPIPAHSK
jgi:hypothetical protein